MKVKTTQAHWNPWGDKLEKTPGDVYELPAAAAAALIAQGLVEDFAAKKAPAAK